MIQELVRDVKLVSNLLRRKPFNCLIQVTNRCNMKCSFCDFWPNGVPAKEELTLDQYRDLERQLSEMGTLFLSIEGGEPFVRPDLVEIVRIFGKRHFPLLFTNGWYVNEKNAKELWAAGLNQVWVSIDYATAEKHDAKRGLKDAFSRAWRAAELLRDSAPYGGKQVHIMTVLMADNRGDVASLLEMSKARGIGHNATLLSKSGYRRGKSEADALPGPEIAAELLALWKRYPHFRIFRNYLERIGSFLEGGKLPTCNAGKQTFNIDHIGNVSPCIEKIDHVLGNIKDAPLAALLAKPDHDAMVAKCQDCWTLCRGMSQAFTGGGEVGAWVDMATRMRYR